MTHNLPMLWQLLDSPVTQLLILAAATALARLLFLSPADPPTAAGAAVMAVGIFGLGAFRQMPFPIPHGAQLITIELLVVWTYLAAALVVSCFKGTFRRHVADPIGCFAIGTWVAGTAVLGRMVNTALPEWKGLALVLGVVTLAVWVPYVALILRRFREIVSGPQANALQRRVTGRVLLSAVSTESVLLLGISLFPDQLPRWATLTIISLGYAFYALGFLLVVNRYVRERGWRLSEDWDNTNCILHGAMSITGLAALQSNAVPGPVIVGTWIWVLTIFLIVEAVELARAGARWKAHGVWRGILTYDVSQWARNFTFGMFYTFTLQLYTSPYYDTQPVGLRIVQDAIVGWGPYVVLLLLLVEAALYFRINIYLRSHKRPGRGRETATEVA